MTERCEWDPANDKPALGERQCSNEATECVGHKGDWHLCLPCSLLPEFNRFKSRQPLKAKGRET